MKQYPEIDSSRKNLRYSAIKNKNCSMERAKANLMMGSSKKLVKGSEAHDGDSCGFIVWPPKNYNCSFCKREFRSAQALGGHMNVHRRDRARLRMLPPPRPLLEYRNPNPSSFASSSSLSFRPPYMPKSMVSPSLINSLSSPSPSSSGFTNEEKKRLLECPQQNALKLKKNTRAAFGAGKLKGHHAQKCDIEVLKKKEEFSISLDLEMGLKDTKEALDLELRLGYH